MVRSKWKNKILLNNFLNKLEFIIYNPNFLILKEFVGKKFIVYEGKFFSEILISEDMVGLNLSTLLVTRYNDGSIHTKKKKKK